MPSANTVLYLLSYLLFDLRPISPGSCRACRQHISCLTSLLLAVQTARYLVKALLGAKKKAPAGGVAYLADAAAEAGCKCQVASPQGWSDPQAQLAALRHAFLKR